MEGYPGSSLRAPISLQQLTQSTQTGTLPRNLAFGELQPLEHLQEHLAALFEVHVLPFVLFADYGTGADRAPRMQAHQIELVAKPMLLPFDARCLVVGHHGDQVEFGVRPYAPRFIDEYPKIGQGVAPRYRNGGEYPRHRVNQGLFDQSVIRHHKTYEPLR